MVLQKVASEGGQRADSEVRIIPESKIIVGVIVGKCFKKVVVVNSNEKQE